MFYIGKYYEMHYFSPIHFPLLWYLCSSKVWNVMAQYLNKYWTVKNLYQCLNKSLMLSLPAFGPKLNWIWLFLCNRNKKLRKSKEIEFYSSLFTLKKSIFPIHWNARAGPRSRLGGVQNPLYVLTKSQMFLLQKSVWNEKNPPLANLKL